MVELQYSTRITRVSELWASIKIQWSASAPQQFLFARIPFCKVIASWIDDT